MDLLLRKHTKGGGGIELLLFRSLSGFYKEEFNHPILVIFFARVFQ